VAIKKKASAAKAVLPLEKNGKGKLDQKKLETWLWDAACSIRGAMDAPKFKDYILPLIFIKRLSDVFDDEVSRLAAEFGDADTALDMAERDRELIRFWVPAESRWPEIRRTTKKIGQKLTDAVRGLSRKNPTLHGVIDLVDFNASVAGERIVGDDRLSGLIEIISRHRLGLEDVRADLFGHAYEYLLRKFAEGSGQSAGEFFTPPEVSSVMAYALAPQEGERIYDPCCGSGGLLIKCQLALMEKNGGKKAARPLQLFGQEEQASNYAMSRMNMIIHDMQGEVMRGDTMRNPKFLDGSAMVTFDKIVANPMWNQDNFTEAVYEADTFDRFIFGDAYAPDSSADWGWMQHITHSLTPAGKAAVILDTGAVSRGSGNRNKSKEKAIRAAFVEEDLIEAVLLLPENLFYNTTAPGIILFVNKAKPKERKDKILLVNAAEEFKKGRPKNYLTATGIKRIATAIKRFKEEERFSQIVYREEIRKNDYNLSPSRYIENALTENYRPISQILKDLKKAETEAAKVDDDLANILTKIGLRV